MNALGSLFALVIMMFAGYYYVTVIAAKSPPQPPQKPLERVEESDGSLGDWIKKQFETQEGREQAEETRALAKLRQVEALDKSRKIAKLHDRLLAENKAFSGEVSKLLKDARGRRIAGSDSLTAEFEEATSGLPATDDIRFLRVKLDLLLEPLKKAVLNKRSVYLPDEEFLTTIWELEVEISGLHAQFVERRKRLESITIRADGELSGVTLGEMLKIRARGGR